MTREEFRQENHEAGVRLLTDLREHFGQWAVLPWQTEDEPCPS